MIDGIRALKKSAQSPNCSMRLFAGPVLFGSDRHVEALRTFLFYAKH
jgi:hypothetical protein